MKIKIGVVNTVADELLDQVGFLALQRNNLERSLGPEVEILIEGSRNGSPDACMEVMFNPFFASLDGKIILEKLHKLQEDGCDGVFVSCSMDVLLTEARSSLRIPVVGAVEASMLSACMAGRKFGFLVHRDRRVAEITEEVVARYGLTSRMGPMVFASERLSEIMMDAYRDPELAREEILKGCAEVVDRGAHSVIIGGIGLANLVTACGIAERPGTRAPVFDPNCVAAQMLRYRIGLKRSLGIPPASHAGAYRPLPESMGAQAMRAFEFAA